MRSVLKWIYYMIWNTIIDFILLFVGIFSYKARRHYIKTFYPELLDKEEKNEN